MTAGTVMMWHRLATTGGNFTGYVVVDVNVVVAILPDVFDAEIPITV